jgi:hypothetical protein
MISEQRLFGLGTGFFGLNIEFLFGVPDWKFSISFFEFGEQIFLHDSWFVSYDPAYRGKPAIHILSEKQINATSDDCCASLLV